MSTDGVLVRIESPRVNLELRAGTLAVAFGREASGASEILRAVVGHSRIPATRIEVLGVDVTAARVMDLVPLRRRIGFVFRETGLLSNMTIEENVALPIRYHTSHQGAAIAGRVQQLLDQFGLGPMRRHRPEAVDHFTRKRAASRAPCRSIRTSFWPIILSRDSIPSAPRASWKS
jgi:ABC-type ATPase involved in cell division